MLGRTAAASDEARREKLERHTPLSGRRRILRTRSLRRKTLASLGRHRFSLCPEKRIYTYHIFHHSPDSHKPTRGYAPHSHTKTLPVQPADYTPMCLVRLIRLGNHSSRRSRMRKGFGLLGRTSRKSCSTGWSGTGRVLLRVTEL